jgi:hypothetical protein
MPDLKEVNSVEEVPELAPLANIGSIQTGHANEGR